jgi:hypothetical protein
MLIEVRPHPENDLASLRILQLFYPVWLVFFALSSSSLPILSDVFGIENLVLPILPPSLAIILAK